MTGSFTPVSGWIRMMKFSRHPASEIMRAHQPEKVLAAVREIMRAPMPNQAE
jgi:hypothetical protein